MSRAQQHITFRETADAQYPYEAEVGGVRWRIRVNEPTPGGARYSLMIDDHAVEELAEWPAAWTRPAPDDPHEKAEYDRELAQFERTRNIPPWKPVK